MLSRLSRSFSISVNLGKASAILPGTMKSVEYNGDKYAVLVFNKNGKFFATGGKCPHYGAPLVTGKFSDGKVFCPWHAATFDVETGEALTFPPVQDIASYTTAINEAGELIVHLPDNTTSPSKYTDHHMTLRNPNNKTRYVIIGAGAAGESAAQTLRKNGFAGEVVVISNEDTLPYDRVTLSKNFKVTPEQIWLRPQEFYTTYGIDIVHNKEVTSIDTASKTLALSDNSSLKYDKLLIASGSSARVLPAHSSSISLQNVCTIRSVSDHNKIKPVLQSAQKVVIIGGSFLGLESANSIKSNFPNTEVTVIELETVPLKRIMGEKIGSLLKSSLEAKGVKFLLGKTASAINSSNNVATSVTVDGQNLPLDLLILSTGAKMNTKFVPTELLNEDGSVRCSAFLQTDNRDVFAAGDISNYVNVFTGDRNRIEHWSVAQEMGKIAALNMVGKLTPFSAVPFFWSNQAVNIQFIGFHGELGHTETVNRGTPTEGHISYFFKGNQTVGVAIGNWFGAAVKFKALYESHSLPTRAELERGKKYSDL